MRVLLVEDDPLLGNGICTGLKQGGYTVDWVKDGREAITALSAEHFDAVILDINLPKVSGFEVLRHCRAEGNVVPILMLTGRDTTQDKVQGLDGGADDYLVKPFHLPELQARLRALVRRARGRAQPLLVNGNLTLDPAAREVRLDDEIVELSSREYSLLQVLMENAGKVMSRSRLEEVLYGWAEEVASNAVEVHIHHLRRKLGNDRIRTVRGLGYMLEKRS